jgi:cytochrome c oxidase accessory protein FixG
MPDETLLKPQGRVLSTLESDGSRRWLTPKLSTGRFWHQRRIVAYLLIAIFTLIPYVPINAQGDPLILFDLLHRKLYLFGFTFLPTDTIYLALFLVSSILSIFFITALLGRVWCGWGCPQTVYMEYVFRPIERFFLGRSGQGGKPRADVPAWRKIAMYVVYLIICLHMANTFLAYFVPYRELHTWIMSPPWEHPAGFMIVMFVTGMMMFDFAYWREQMCIIGCPYGRFQSVLLDRNSLIISYDPVRGEPRGKGKRTGSKQSAVGSEQYRTISLPTANSPLQTESKPQLGDCVDCGLCSAVCPTGIDIRDGLQIECVACAQCIDVCDGVMDKIGLPKGLIRYSSQSKIAGEKQRILRPRVIIYSIVLAILLTLLTMLLVTKKPFDLMVIRNKGLPFTVTPAGMVENTWILKLTNRSEVPRTFTVSVRGREDIIVSPQTETITLVPGEVRDEPIRLIVDRSAYANGHIRTDLLVTDQDGIAQQRTILLLGPAGGSHVGQ